MIFTTRRKARRERQKAERQRDAERLELDRQMHRAAVKLGQSIDSKQAQLNELRKALETHRASTIVEQTRTAERIRSIARVLAQRLEIHDDDLERLR